VATPVPEQASQVLLAFLANLVAQVSQVAAAVQAEQPMIQVTHKLA